MYSPNLEIEGVLNLKRIYRRNMLFGFGISAGFSILVTGAMAIIIFLNTNTIPVITVNDNPGGVIFLPPPTTDPRPAEPIKTPEGDIPISGGIIAVPDDEAPDDTIILTQDDLKGLAPIAPVIDNIKDFGKNYDPDAILASFYPPQGEFVPFDIMAEKIMDIKPSYPELAVRSGVECHLWVTALVDKEGKTVDVKILKSSNEGIGFEESAIAAAYKTVWKPAISNGHPVAIWVTYKVDYIIN